MIYNMVFEMKRTSTSGVDLNSKSVLVAYYDDIPESDFTFVSSVSEGFSLGLKTNEGIEEPQRLVLAYSDTSNIVSKQLAIDLLMESDKDAVFILGVPTITESTYSVPLYCYDSMAKRDTLLAFDVHGILGNSKDLYQSGLSVGASMSNSFISQWVEETYSIYYLNSNRWLLAAEYAANCKWKEAMEQWIECLKTNDPYVRSCAEYNIALACYMTSKKQLALDWLEMSDRDYKLNQTKNLRNKIQKL